MAESGSIDHVALASLLDMVGGDEAFLNEMIDTYFDDTPTLVAAMRQALVSGDAVALRLSAHALKSNSANFGAPRLAALCQALEEQGSANTLDGASALLAQVEAEYGTVRQALEAARPAG